MIFVYDKAEPRLFTMKKTNFDLLIYFLDENYNIVKKEIGRARQNISIKCEKPAKIVIEIPV